MGKGDLPAKAASNTRKMISFFVANTSEHKTLYNRQGRVPSSQKGGSASKQNERTDREDEDYDSAEEKEEEEEEKDKIYGDMYAAVETGGDEEPEDGVDDDDEEHEGTGEKRKRNQNEARKLDEDDAIIILEERTIARWRIFQSCYNRWAC